MAKYRKKPVVIDATPAQDSSFICTCDDGKGLVHIHTLEGAMRVSPGDMVITGVAGEHYSCKPDIFEKTYEAVD
jgi:hypothetical protein